MIDGMGIRHAPGGLHRIDGHRFLARLPHDELRTSQAPGRAVPRVPRPRRGPRLRWGRGRRGRLRGRRRRRRRRDGGGGGGGRRRRGRRRGGVAARASSPRTTSACTAWTASSRSSRSCRPTTSSTRRWSGATASGRRALLTRPTSTSTTTRVADAHRARSTRRSVGKTDFWTHAHALFGVTLPPGQGLKGLYMPADAPRPGPAAVHLRPRRRAGSRPRASRSRRVDDAGATNPYPLLRVTRARPRHAARSSRTSTSSCRSRRRPSAATATRPAASPRRRRASRGPRRRPRGAGEAERPAAARRARGARTSFGSQPVLCARCHYSPRARPRGRGAAGRAEVGSRAFSAMPRSTARSTRRHPSSRPAARAARPATSATPARSRSARAAPWRPAGIECRDCHGDMAAVGGETALRAGGSLDGTADGAPRRAVDGPAALPVVPHRRRAHPPVRARATCWRPTASACSRRGDDGRRRRPPPILAPTSRFAENPNTLYRFSTGHGGLLLPGLPRQHARGVADRGCRPRTTTSRRPQLQGHAGTISECSACHAAGHAAADDRRPARHAQRRRLPLGRRGPRRLLRAQPVRARPATARTCRARCSPARPPTARSASRTRAPSGSPRARRSAAPTATRSRVERTGPPPGSAPGGGSRPRAADPSRPGAPDVSSRPLRTRWPGDDSALDDRGDAAGAAHPRARGPRRARRAHPRAVRPQGDRPRGAETAARSVRARLAGAPGTEVIELGRASRSRPSAASRRGSGRASRSSWTTTCSSTGVVRAAPRAGGGGRPDRVAGDPRAGPARPWRAQDAPTSSSATLHVRRGRVARGSTSRGAHRGLPLEALPREPVEGDLLEMHAVLLETAAPPSASTCRP